MALISDDSFALAARFANKDQTRRQLYELCVSARFAMDRNRVSPTVAKHIIEIWCVFGSENTPGTNVRYREDLPKVDDVIYLDYPSRNREWYVDKPLRLSIIDSDGSHESKVDDYLARFRDLRSVVIGTTSETAYSAHNFQEKFPFVSVLIARFISIDRSERHILRLRGDLHAKNSLGPSIAIEDALNFLSSDYSYCRDASYESPTAVVNVAPTGDGPQREWTKFQTESVERLIMEYRHCGLGASRDYALSCAQMYLRTSAKDRFTNLRKLSIQTEGHAPTILKLLERSRHTSFPLLDTIYLCPSVVGANISSSFLKHIRIDREATNTLISCPTCESLDVNRPTALVLSRDTRPRTMTLRNCRELPSSTLERIAASAIKLVFRRFDSIVCPDLPPTLPNLKILVVAERMYDKKHSKPFRLFAPQLEEVWHGGSLRSPPCDENGAYIVDFDT